MGDRASTKLVDGMSWAVQVIEKGVFHVHGSELPRVLIVRQPALRDEIYCQICKQITLNPNAISEEQGRHGILAMLSLLGWRLITACVGFFPPSRNLEPWLSGFFSEHSKTNNKVLLALPNESIFIFGQCGQYATYCHEHLAHICRTTPTCRVPTTKEAEREMVATLLALSGVCCLTEHDIGQAL